MKSILITGGNGQLGECIQSIEKQFGNDNVFLYLTVNDLDITNLSQIDSVVDKYKPDYIVNCAAYTAVDKAETDKEIAYAINAYGVENLAKICKLKGIILIHISTDFVFGDVPSVPLTEDMIAEPFGVYGESKLMGEQLLQQNMDNYFILRTSWLYSEFHNNFLKTMLRLGKEKEELSVVFDQVGTPTYAKDLAETIIYIINSQSVAYGIYHYSNEGVASWYDFAFEIFKLTDSKMNLKPITSDQFPTPAKRPNYSVMNKTKIKQNFDIQIKHWTISLAECIKKI